MAKNLLQLAECRNELKQKWLAENHINSVVVVIEDDIREQCEESLKGENLDRPLNAQQVALHLLWHAYDLSTFAMETLRERVSSEPPHTFFQFPFLIDTSKGTFKILLDSIKNCMHQISLESNSETTKKKYIYLLITVLQSRKYFPICIKLFHCVNDCCFCLQW